MTEATEDIFFKPVVARLLTDGFLCHPIRQRGLRGLVAVMLRGAHLVIVHGPYHSGCDQKPAVAVEDPIVTQTYPEDDRLESIQYEFDLYLGKVILPMIDRHARALNSRAVTFIIPGGGGLKIPAELLESEGIRVVTGNRPEQIRLDFPDAGMPDP